MNDKEFYIYQHGSALITALILLLISTAMGMTVMQSSTMEFRMTTNAIQSKAVFQAAESATEQALNSTSSLNLSYKEGISGQHTLDLSLDEFSEVEGSASVRYIGGGMVPGSSVGVFEGLRFEVHGTANINNEIRAGVTQGAVRVVPAN